MDFDRLNRWMTLGANLGVVAGLMFLALEVRTNTQANRLTQIDSLSQFYVEGNRQIAENGELAEIVERASLGEKLSGVELRRFRSYVSMRLTRVNNMLRKYDEGLATEADLRDALRGVRIQAQGDTEFRRRIEEIDDNERLRSIILDEDGLDKWL